MVLVARLVDRDVDVVVARLVAGAPLIAWPALTELRAQPPGVVAPRASIVGDMLNLSREGTGLRRLVVGLCPGRGVVLMTARGAVAVLLSRTVLVFVVVGHWRLLSEPG